MIEVIEAFVNSWFFTYLLLPIVCFQLFIIGLSGRW